MKFTAAILALIYGSFTNAFMTRTIARNRLTTTLKYKSVIEDKPSNVAEDKNAGIHSELENDKLCLIDPILGLCSIATARDLSASTVLNESAVHSSFHELFKLEGLHVMKSQDVPSHFHVDERNVAFPPHWFPDATKFSSEEEAVAMENRFRSELLEAGAFHHVKFAFHQVDCGLFGGKMRLQPSTTELGAYHTHQFIVAFALWDDLIEEAEDFAAIGRLIQLVKVTQKNDHKLKQDLVSEDSTGFMKFWLLHLNSVASVCAGMDNAIFDRYAETFITWCNALTEEMEQLCNLDPDEDAIKRQWDSRIQSVGGTVVFDLVALACNFKPSSELYDDLFALKYQYSKILREVNEVASIPKDVKDECGSLFTSTMIVKGTTVSETTTEFVNRIVESIEKYDDLAANLVLKHSDTLVSGEKQALLDFLDAIRFSTVGLSEWHLQNVEGTFKRYNRIKIVNPKHEEVMQFGISSVPTCVLK